MRSTEPRRREKPPTPPPPTGPMTRAALRVTVAAIVGCFVGAIGGAAIGASGERGWATLLGGVVGLLAGGLVGFWYATRTPGAGGPGKPRIKPGEGLSDHILAL